MRELLVLRRLAESYRTLGLRQYRAWLTLCFMLVTAVLEMLGLSILYPLVLVVGGGVGIPGTASRLLGSLVPRGPRPAEQILMLFAAVAVLNLAKNIVLYYTYR